MHCGLRGRRDALLEARRSPLNEHECTDEHSRDWVPPAHLLACCDGVAGQSPAALAKLVHHQLCWHYSNSASEGGAVRCAAPSNNVCVVAAPRLPLRALLPRKRTALGRPGGWQASKAPGRDRSAQYSQAPAARAVPEVRMNPLLLWPEADTRNQVVLLEQW